jgi:hypothetical protein
MHQSSFTLLLLLQQSSAPAYVSCFVNVSAVSDLPSLSQWVNVIHRLVENVC